jgi:serine protease AprX
MSSGDWRFVFYEPYKESAIGALEFASIGESIVKKVFRLLLICVVSITLFGWGQPAQAGQAFQVPGGNLAARVAPSVRDSLAGLGPNDFLTVIVTLRQQADLSQVGGTSRAARLQDVIRALQATANATQGPLDGLFRARQQQGLVQSYQPFWIFNGFSVTATQGVIDELAGRPDVLSINPDDVSIVPSAGAPEPNISLIQAPALWSLGYTGQGVVVASMDTGVDVSHPDLAARWRNGSNSWFDPYNQHSTPADLNGHGTETMGIMVGGDRSGTSIGVAPGAQWIAVKIFNDRGRSSSTKIHDGFQWLLDPDGDPGTDDAPQVVNNSWTFSNPGCYLDFEPDLQALRAAGILPVFAAGNGGPYANSSYSPSNNPSAFAVGATDNSDQIYAYSSRGPSACSGSTGPFPVLVAPGVNILTTGLYGTYTTDSGTSLSAPHVAGGLALLLSAYPNLTADGQESALIDSAVDLGPSGPDDTYGYGRLDLLAAFNLVASAPPPSPTPTSQPTPTPTPTPAPTATPTPVPATTMHVGDLDGSTSLSRNKWNATVTIHVHDTNENPVAGVSVSGQWSNGPSGSDACLTNSSGVCQVAITGLNSKTMSSVTFSVTGLNQSSLSYDSSANHDPDGDSDGTSLTILAP